MASNGFTRKQRRKLLERDGNMCRFCYKFFPEEQLQTHHRLNRGMGGDKTVNVLSNGLMLCGYCNQIIEADNQKRNLALYLGVKLPLGVNTLEEPYYHPVQDWLLLDDEGNTERVWVDTVTRRKQYGV